MILPMTAFDKIKEKISKFTFEPASARPLAAIRIGVGFILLLQAYMTRSAIWDFFSSMGLLQGELARALSNPAVPQLAWLRDSLAPFGISEAWCIAAVCLTYVISLLFLTFGFFTRAAAIVSWFLHWVLMNSADSTNYGIDIYAHVFLFYMIWAPVGDALSVDALLRGQVDRISSAARLGLRVMQVQLCIAYLSSGIDKSMGIQWRTGDVLFRSVSLPLYRQFDMGWLANWPHLAFVASWSTLILETGYCIFIWPRATRKFWILGIIGLHLGIIFGLGLTLFGLIMCLLTIGAFAVSAEVQPFQVAEKTNQESILLFDGVCHACNAAVNLLLQVDRKHQFLFLPLQSERARTLLRERGVVDNLSTIVLITPTSAFTASSAVFEILLRLGGFWKLFAIFRFLPVALTDYFYFLFARNRYRLFGEANSCRVPDAETLSRFLN
jgi:predicted DCC family thiol-disulfide oxidoreductase YuxK